MKKHIGAIDVGAEASLVRSGIYCSHLLRLLARHAARTGTMTWAQVPIGGGGQTTEIQLSTCATGYGMTRTDTDTPYAKSPGGIWQ